MVRIVFLILLQFYTIYGIPECFNELPGRILRGSSILIFDEFSIVQCRTACLELEKERCRSFSYSVKNGLCQLNSKDRSGGGTLEIAQGDTSYYERFCYDKPSVAILRDESLFKDNCYEMIKGKILIGIVDQLIQDIESIDLCQKACQKSQERYEVVCKSAAFYEKEKECILASQSRHDIPDLFIDDDNAIYIENICLAPKPERQDEIKKVEINKSKKKTTVNSQSSGENKKQDRSNISLENILTTVPSKTSKENVLATVEESGYDSPSSDITNHKTEESVLSSTPKNVPTIDPKIVDSYAMETTSVTSAPVAAVMNSKSSSYNRRLKDERVRTCFTEVKPVEQFIEARISKAYSLEQCTDICRLCWRCLRGKKCQSIAFDSDKEMCALSLSPLIDGGLNNSKFVYHNRGEC